MLTVLQVAKACHEINRAYCIAIGDDSQLEWIDAPDWQKDSAIVGVTKIINGIVKKPEDSHTSWMIQKIADGWTYGPIKDPEKKTHPCMVEFDKLSKEQQIKDHLFLATAKTLLKIV